MSRPIEGSSVTGLAFDLVESMKFKLQSVSISSTVRKKVASSSYLDNANMTSVTMSPSFHRSYVVCLDSLFLPFTACRSYSTSSYGTVRDTNSLRSLAHHFQLYFNRMNRVFADRASEA